LADSETRPVAPVEKAFFDKVIEACRTSVATVNLWEKLDVSGQESSDYDFLVTGSENMPLVHHYYIEWADQQQIEKANHAISEALAAKLPDAQEAAENVDLKQLESIAEQIAAAATAGNMAEVERLNKLAEEISVQNEQLFAETDREFRETIEKLAARDARAVIRIGINQFYQGFDAEPVTGKLPDGTVFYRVENGRMYNESWVEGTTYLLFGQNWKMQQDEAGFSIEKTEETDKPHTKVQTIVVAIEAEQKRARQILDAMNIKALQALLNQ
jgi:hypothetical protein